METTIHTVQNMDDLNGILEKKDAVLLYFSHDKCNVCKVLKPKIAELLLASEFPKMEMLYVNTEKLPEVAGRYRVFVVPTVSLLFQGKEGLRYSRNLSVPELATAIERPYSMIFEK